MTRVDIGRQDSTTAFSVCSESKVRMMVVSKCGSFSNRARFEWLAGVAGTNRPRRQVLGDDRARADNRALSDRHAGTDKRFGADPRLRADGDRRGIELKIGALMIVRSCAEIRAL